MYQQPGDPNAQSQNPYYPPSNPQWPTTGPDYTPSGADQPSYAPYPTSYPPTQPGTPPPPYAPQSGTQYGGYPGGPGYVPPPPPRKSNSRLIMIIAGIVLAVLLVGGVAFALGHQGTTNTTSTPTPAANSNTPAPAGNTPTVGDTPTSSGITPTSQTTTGNGKVGQAVQAGPNYSITVNSVKTNTGDEFNQPKAGNIYIIIDVTVKNTSSSPQDVSSFINFELQDSTGQKYDEAITDIGTPPDQTGLPAGRLIRGQLVYEVPASMHQFTLSFVDILGNGVLASWDLTD